MYVCVLCVCVRVCVLQCTYVFCGRYNTMYVVTSILGCYNPFFFCVHLLDVAYRNKTLQNVLKSVTVNGWQLLLTMLLMAIVV